MSEIVCADFESLYKARALLTAFDILVSEDNRGRMPDKLSSSSEELLARIVSDPQLIREALANPEIEEELLLRLAAHPTLMREVLADPEIEDKWRSRLVANPQLLQKVIERVDIALLDMQAIRLYLYEIKLEGPADRHLVQRISEKKPPDPDDEPSVIT